MEAGQALRANAISFWGSIVGGTWLSAACGDCAIADGLTAMWAASANKQIAVTATPLPCHVIRFFIEFLLCFCRSAFKTFDQHGGGHFSCVNPRGGRFLVLCPEPTDAEYPIRARRTGCSGHARSK